ncbi:Hypothetical protein NTJ_07661 [Nesidiocoris tenuis]|uniref:HIT domain-containing protein n=1 Tax=Nesidiocoris tenuis TaxID=355587 RepID=A0ABN7AWK7_9HEMI|nr:Hypothetical protein NTJ_07661 [Nesidiocoris tenuis]
MKASRSEEDGSSLVVTPLSDPHHIFLHLIPRYNRVETIVFIPDNYNGIYHRGWLPNRLEELGRMEDSQTAVQYMHGGGLCKTPTNRLN